MVVRGCYTVAARDSLSPVAAVFWGSSLFAARMRQTVDAAKAQPFFRGGSWLLHGCCQRLSLRLLQFFWAAYFSQRACTIR